jgi:hypothetical protein
MGFLQRLFGRSSPSHRAGAEAYDAEAFLRESVAALDKVADAAQLNAAQKRYVALGGRVYLEHGRNERAVNEGLIHALRPWPKADQEAVIGLPDRLIHDFLNAVSVAARPYGLRREAILGTLERIDGAHRGPNERNRDTDRLLAALREGTSRQSEGSR